MRARLRDHPVAAVAILTAVSLVIVFGATMQAIPATLLPSVPEQVLTAIPHVNAGLAVIALAAMTAGYRAIRRGEIPRHRRHMLTALAAFFLFLVLYLYNVAVTGPGTFPGPAVIRTYVYLPLLAVHVGLAIVCIPLLYYAVIVAATRPVAAIPESNHARVARPALALWAVSFVLGLVVYLQLYVIY